MLRSSLLLCAAAAVAAEDLTITVGMQVGFFKTGEDVGAINPHDYRPNEFVVNDFIYEGLTAWDGAHPDGADGVEGTHDDYVKPALATSWTTNYESVKANGGAYTITFTLRSGVTFHDGTPWNAAAAVTNFNHIMGSDGSCGAVKATAGFHDWIGFTQSVDCWDAPDDLTFTLTFDTYYENALRELAIIRPFRMGSPATMPKLADRELSAQQWKWGHPRMFPMKCWSEESEPGKSMGGPAGKGTDPLNPTCWTMRGVSAPVGTGPYSVVEKVLKPTGRKIPAADFNATCYDGNLCVYNDGETVDQVIFKKVEGHWKNPSYEHVILQSYDSLTDIKNALLDSSLDIAYGVQTLSPSGFLSIATSGASNVVAHKADIEHDINTRLIVHNSAGRLKDIEQRKHVFGILAKARDALYGGELAEEEPMDTLFNYTQPHCGVLKQWAVGETTPPSPEVVGTPSAGFVFDKATFPTIRFMYKPDIPHESMIASWVIGNLIQNDIKVKPIPVSKGDYNSLNCEYMDFVYYGENPDHEYYDDDYHAWDLAYSESWGPPYDPASKLWDMTHGLMSGGWCSAEADAPAVTAMSSMTAEVFKTKVRSLSTTIDATARTALYDEVLTTLHNEAIFLPLTAKRQTAVTSTSVDGFQFGYLEFDLPLANLAPAPPPPPAESNDDLSAGAIAGIAVAAGCAALLCMIVCVMFMKERSGTPIFTPVGGAAASKKPPVDASAA